jgi:hypothetical protein
MAVHHQIGALVYPLNLEHSSDELRNNWDEGERGFKDTEGFCCCENSVLEVAGQCFANAVAWSGLVAVQRGRPPPDIAKFQMQPLVQAKRALAQGASIVSDEEQQAMTAHA